MVGHNSNHLVRFTKSRYELRYMPTTPDILKYGDFVADAFGHAGDVYSLDGNKKLARWIMFSGLVIC